MLAGVLAAALGEQSSSVTVLARDGGRVRFLVTSRAGIDKVRAWLDEGVAWGDALVRLHAPTPATTPRGDA